jgi:hypothetical protein
MHSAKRYSNVNITKRVDHDGGLHRESRAVREPAVCPQCAAVLSSRRWTRARDVRESRAERTVPVREVICPACRKTNARQPEGIVTLEGRFVAAHLQEIENLLRNEAERAAYVNPLARVIDWGLAKGERLVVSTTTPHLAQRFGHALRKAFGGAVEFTYSHENKLTRVVWRRE